MKNVTKKNIFFISKQQENNSLFILSYLGKALLISWFYAICSQIIIPLPFSLVPLSIQPLPIFLLTLLIGSQAITGYTLYLLQGALGAPFFAYGLCGLARLIGPTGGYLFGFLLSALFLHSLRNYGKKSILLLTTKIILANVLFFSCGLLQLSLYVPTINLFRLGLYPFIIGDFFIKTACLVLATLGTTQISSWIQKK